MQPSLPTPPSTSPIPIDQSGPLCGLPLTRVLGIENITDFRVHFAVKGDQGNVEPVDAYWQSRWEWNQWNANAAPQGAGGLYKRKYIISLMRWIPPKTDLWLFGCIYEVMGGWPKMNVQEEPVPGKKRWAYELKSIDIGKGHSGRLIVTAPKPKDKRNVRRNLIRSLSNSLVVYGEIGAPHRKWNWF